MSLSDETGANHLALLRTVNIRVNFPQSGCEHPVCARPPNRHIHGYFFGFIELSSQIFLNSFKRTFDPLKSTFQSLIKRSKLSSSHFKYRNEINLYCTEKLETFRKLTVFKDFAQTSDTCQKEKHSAIFLSIPISCLTLCWGYRCCHLKRGKKG